MRPATTTASSADAVIQGVSRPRKYSDAPATADDRDRDRDHSPPMMYFLADEATVQAATATVASAPASASASASASTSVSASMSSHASSSTFGVRSLQASVSDSELRGGSSKRNSPAPAVAPVAAAAAAEEVGNEEDQDHQGEEEEDEVLDRFDTRSMTSLSTANPDFMSGVPSPKTNMSVPLTPMLGPSISSSPIGGSPAASRSRSASGGGDDFFGGGGPQLIMPQIIIPSRRPFTEKGKRIGRLKILIAGDSGSYSYELQYLCCVAD